MHRDATWGVVLHARTRLIESVKLSCIVALLLQSHAKGSHAFWPQHQNCTSRWWWICNRYHISPMPFCQLLETLPKDPCLCSIFPSSVVGTDHWSARNCWWTPEHCTEQGRRQYPCILIPESEPLQDEWRWCKWRKFWSVAHLSFGWYEVLVENCHLLMQLSRFKNAHTWYLLVPAHRAAKFT